MRYSFGAFLALAITFIAIGATGQRTFIYVGIVFLVLALVMMRKRRKPD
jgi:LPXTG-motif cell wall-anchored protein